MKQLSGFENPQATNIVCKLHKALYRLKQAPKTWFEKVYGVLLALGFFSARSDKTLFVKTTTQCIIYLLVYVDDILITGNDQKAINTLIQSLHKEFKLIYLGLSVISWVFKPLI